MSLPRTPSGHESGNMRPDLNQEAEMCPVCLSTVALVAATTGSAGGLAAVITRRVRSRRAASVGTRDTPAILPAEEESAQ